MDTHEVGKKRENADETISAWKKYKISGSERLKNWLRVFGFLLLNGIDFNGLNVLKIIVGKRLFSIIITPPKGLLPFLHVRFQNSCKKGRKCMFSFKNYVLRKDKNSSKKTTKMHF